MRPATPAQAETCEAASAGSTWMHGIFQKQKARREGRRAQRSVVFRQKCRSRATRRDRRRTALEQTRPKCGVNLREPGGG